jgi:predicted negative regulator of RcsB-dependent stress response
MATYDLEEQEQLAELKAWWKMYGNLVVNVLLAVLVVVAAWLGWNRYQGSQASQAAMVYNVLQNAAPTKDSPRIKAANRWHKLRVAWRTDYCQSDDRRG